MAALALFAVSSAPFRPSCGQRSSRWVELVGHHASLPLALCILLQDYRFAFADLFLKSAVALLLLMAVALGACFGVFVPLMRWHAVAGPLDPGALAAMVLVWVAAASALLAVRPVSAWFVDRVVLRRPDYDKTLTRVRRHDPAGRKTDLDVERRLRPRGPARHGRDVTAASAWLTRFPIWTVAWWSRAPTFGPLWSSPQSRSCSGCAPWTPLTRRSSSAR